MTNFKRQAINETVNYLQSEMGGTVLEVVSKLQAQAAKKDNENLLDDLCEYKSEIINAISA